VPPAEGWTETLKVMDWAKFAGLRPEASVVAVEAWLIVCVRVEDVLDAKLLSPLYFTVRECAPWERLEIVS